MNNVILILVVYLAVVNVIGFFAMGLDKLKAKKRAWRIPEATLFIIALIGGALGTTAGMHVFHHKTKHWYFLYGMPAILVIQLVLVLFIHLSPIEIKVF